MNQILLKSCYVVAIIHLMNDKMISCLWTGVTAEVSDVSFGEWSHTCERHPWVIPRISKSDYICFHFDDSLGLVMIMMMMMIMKIVMIKMVTVMVMMIILSSGGWLDGDCHYITQDWNCMCKKTLWDHIQKWQKLNAKTEFHQDLIGIDVQTSNWNWANGNKYLNHITIKLQGWVLDSLLTKQCLS